MRLYQALRRQPIAMLPSIATLTAPTAAGRTAPLAAPLTTLFAQALAGQLGHAKAGSGAALTPLLNQDTDADQPAPAELTATVAADEATTVAPQDAAVAALLGVMTTPSPFLSTPVFQSAETASIAVADSQKTPATRGKSLPAGLAAIAAAALPAAPPDTATEPAVFGPGVATDPAPPADAMALPLLTAPLPTPPAAESALATASAPPAASSPETAALAASAPPSGNTGERPPLSLPPTVGTVNWDQALGERLVWLSSRQGQWADLTLNPPSLGSLEVHLHLTGGEAGAQFYSPHASVREAIESALPRLREMMAAAGLALGEATVGDRSDPQRQPRTNTGASTGGYPMFRQAVESAGAVSMSGGHGLVDFYV